MTEVIDNSFATCMKDQTVVAGLSDLTAFNLLLDVLESKLTPDELVMIETEFTARSECVEKDELPWYAELYVANINACDTRGMRVTGVTEEDARRAVHGAFGSTDWLPEMDAIPEEFKRRGTPAKGSWAELVETMFYAGLPGLEYIPREGVEDPEKVTTFLLSHTRSFAPKHEHKIAGIAYRLSQVLVGARVQGSEGPITFGDWPEEEED